jgi:hypothetical protein
MAHRDGAARLLPLPAADRAAVQPGLHRPGAGQQRRHRASAGRPVRGALRSGRGGAGAPRRAGAHRQRICTARSNWSPARTRTASCAPSGMPVRHGAHQRLSAHRRTVSSRNTCPSRSRASSCANCRCRSRCSKYSCSRRAWKACTCAWATSRAAASAGPTGARISHRDPRPDEGAARQEHGHRAGRRQGRLRRAAPPGDREAQQAEVIACYQTLIRGCSTSPTTSSATRSSPPPDVVRHDGDDPYLVVAADKGTATFSDIANAISAEYGFWLGDAFASGGSAGYDHKKMAITARGAWECVKRHFREIGVDIQNQDFTVAGIGDMAGDVFGNGMLQSRTSGWSRPSIISIFSSIRRPDAARGFREREAAVQAAALELGGLFARRMLSGGGVFSRSAKSLTLSREAQALLELAGRRPRPNEVIKAILRMHVDLIVERRHRHLREGRSESHRDVGDRSNDAVRIDGRELRCKVIGEGGNLGSRSSAASNTRARRPAQHRLHRQFRRRELLGRRGEPEDPAERRGARRGNHARRARPAAGADDRRSRGTGAAQQLPAEPGDQHQRVAVQGAPERRAPMSSARWSFRAI